MPGRLTGVVHPQPVGAVRRPRYVQLSSGIRTADVSCRSRGRRIAVRDGEHPVDRLSIETNVGMVEAAGVELSRVVCDDERLLHAQQRTTRRVTTRSRQFRPVGQRLGSSWWRAETGY